MKPNMGFGNLLKTLMALYLSIWLLILKQLKVVYQLDGNNFGVIFGIVGFFRKRDSSEQPVKRTVSLPSLKKSKSIRERRRFLSDPDPRPQRNRKENPFATQHFVLRKKPSTTTTNTTIILDSNSDSKNSSNQNSFGDATTGNDVKARCKQHDTVGKLRYTCRKSLIYAKEEKQSSSRNSPPLTLTLDSKNNSKTDDNLCDLDLVSRQMLMIQRGRAFTFPDIPPRARTVSETAEEIDQVMPLPHIAKKRTWKSCNAIQSNNNSSTVLRKSALYASTNKKLKMSQLKSAAAADINGLRKMVHVQNGSLPCNNGPNVLRKSRSSDSRNLDMKNVAMAGTATTAAEFNNVSSSNVGLHKIRSSESRNLETPILWKRLHKCHKDNNSYQNSSKIHTHLVNTSRSNSTVIKVEQRGP